MNSRVFVSRARRSIVVAGAAATAVAFSGCSVNNKNDDEVAGKQLFVQKCGSCHTLSRAATKGTVGPNLDEAFRQSLADGFGRAAVRGVIYQQVKHPGRGSAMPNNLVDDEGARDVAAYVSAVAAAGGKDTGVLAAAVKAAGSDKPAVAANGVLTIPADPGGQLLYTNKTAEAPAGAIDIVMENKSTVIHDLVIDGVGRTKQLAGGSSDFKANLKAGKYTYYCSLPGHRAAGMEGTLTVK